MFSVVFSSSRVARVATPFVSSIIPVMIPPVNVAGRWK